MDLDTKYSFITNIHLASFPSHTKYEGIDQICSECGVNLRNILLMLSSTKPSLSNCPDCDAKPGSIHEDGCDVERCSVCGSQRLGCACEGHDPQFARWTGIWPGLAESEHLGIDLNQLYMQGTFRVLFIKPPITTS